jgi:hypothetical protein
LQEFCKISKNWGKIKAGWKAGYNLLINGLNGQPITIKSKYVKKFLAVEGVNGKPITDNC